MPSARQANKRAEAEKNDRGEHQEFGAAQLAPMLISKFGALLGLDFDGGVNHKIRALTKMKSEENEGGPCQTDAGADGKQKCDGRGARHNLTRVGSVRERASARFGGEGVVGPRRRPENY